MRAFQLFIAPRLKLECFLVSIAGGYGMAHSYN
jgi:hypothetical protein